MKMNNEVLIIGCCDNKITNSIKENLCNIVETAFCDKKVCTNQNYEIKVENETYNLYSELIFADSSTQFIKVSINHKSQYVLELILEIRN